MRSKVKGFDGIYPNLFRQQLERLSVRYLRVRVAERWWCKTSEARWFRRTVYLTQKNQCRLWYNTRRTWPQQSFVVAPNSGYCTRSSDRWSFPSLKAYTDFLATADRSLHQSSDLLSRSWVFQISAILAPRPAAEIEYLPRIRREKAAAVNEDCRGSVCKTIPVVETYKHQRLHTYSL
jgi:hypothetical protein